MTIPVDLGSLIEPKQLASAAIGATLALLGQALVGRVSRAKTARGLCVAYWEELQSVQFYGGNFAGFSSQTFDALFRELATTLPDTLMRDIMRYHWRMKYLESTKPQVLPQGNINPPMLSEARDLNERLSSRLDHYSRRGTWSRFLQRGETCSKKLLAAAA